MIRILSKAKLLIGEYICFGQIFLIGCLMMGSAMKVNSTMDKLVYYFILGSDNRDCVELGSEENDEAYISTYYTINEKSMRAFYLRLSKNMNMHMRCVNYRS